MIKIDDRDNISSSELERLSQNIKTNNYALYDIGSGLSLQQSKDFIIKLGQLFDLKSLDANLCADEDGITPLAVSEQKGRKNYIPYSTKAINWHTDGYYNLPENTVRGMLLHCVQPAPKGGASQLINPDLVYAKIKEHSLEYIQKLSQPDVMTIPANIVDGVEIRAEQTGPVFSFDANNNLHMRYTARKHNIIWHPNAKEAVAYLEQLLADPSGHFTAELTLASGQGVICNNVLHTRKTFENTETCERVMLRARYYNRLDISHLHKG